MKSESVAALVSAAIALGAAVVALHAARGNSVRAAYELARSLYTELTSKDTATLRSSLTFYRLAETRTAEDTRRIIDDYFALLWQFERIHAGRESLVGQRRLNGTGPAVDYLDNMIRGHVNEWASHWIDIRTKIKEHVPNLEDHPPLKEFCKLAEKINPAGTHAHGIRAALADEQQRRIQRASN
ncbi:hypothetical protein [Streptomyces yerevanensis]|uniref:hypothetical protein n=1 Tax=Streptomyces yerevanensis TaxID=66378 RepID=UPI000524D624|nr:hypothetical protein [Streptomyces yerevanensis]